MQKKLTITVHEEGYAGLRKVIGPRRISRFIEDLVRPHVVKARLKSAYKRMAQDEAREAQALEWSEATTINPVRFSVSKPRSKDFCPG